MLVQSVATSSVPTARARFCSRHRRSLQAGSPPLVPSSEVTELLARLVHNSVAMFQAHFPFAATDVPAAMINP
jgi:hypothetical protein